MKIFETFPNKVCITSLFKFTIIKFKEIQKLLLKKEKKQKFTQKKMFTFKNSGKQKSKN